VGTAGGDTAQRTGRDQTSWGKFVGSRGDTARRTGRDDIMRVERRSTYETIETEKHGYRDDDPCKHPSHETGRDAIRTTTRSVLN